MWLTFRSSHVYIRRNMLRLLKLLFLLQISCLPQLGAQGAAVKENMDVFRLPNDTEPISYRSAMCEYTQGEGEGENKNRPLFYFLLIGREKDDNIQFLHGFSVERRLLECSNYYYSLLFGSYKFTFLHILIRPQINTLYTVLQKS